MTERRYTSQSSEETKVIAAELADNCASNIGAIVLTLNGELGAGKTAFAQGFIGQLCKTNEVCSPTFSLLQQYETSQGKSVYHMDWYRIEKAEEVEELGWWEWLSQDCFILVEWADKFPILLPDNRVEVMLLHPLLEDVKEADKANPRDIEIKEMS